MNTSKNHPVSVSTTHDNTRSASGIWEKAEFYRFGITPMLLGIIAIVGGLAGAIGIGESPLQLLAVSVSTVVALSTILGVMPMRTIVICCSIAILIDLLIISF